MGTVLTLPWKRGQEQTMQSTEIAELCSKRHDHVMRDIRQMLIELHGEADLPKFGGVYRGGNGEHRPCFHLPKRETLILISGYSTVLRARIIDRWQELESKASDVSKALSDPATLRKLLAAYSDQNERLAFEVNNLRPIAAAHHRLTGTPGSVTVTEAAKILGLTRKNLMDRLLAKDWIYRRGSGPYHASELLARYGWIEEKITTVRTNDTERITTQVRITAAGLQLLAAMH